MAGLLRLFGDRSFAVAGPRVWNSLPATIRQITSYEQFRQHLKTRISGPRNCSVPWLLIILRYTNTLTNLLTSSFAAREVPLQRSRLRRSLHPAPLLLQQLLLWRRCDCMTDVHADAVSSLLHHEAEKRNDLSFMNKYFNAQCNLAKFSTLAVNKYYHRCYLFNFWNLH